MPLFREEAMKAEAGRLHGTVQIAIPVSWHLLGGLLLSAILLSSWFLFSSSYARVEVVTGAITSDRGVADVIPTRAGVLAEVHVHEGEKVTKGEPLVVVRAEENNPDGTSAQEALLAQITKQDRRLDDQLNATKIAAVAESARLNSKIDGFRSEIAFLTAQIGFQVGLISTAESDLNLVNKFGSTAVISQHDINARQDLLLSRRQQLSQLEETKFSRSEAFSEAKLDLARNTAQVNSEVFRLESERAELSQRVAQTQATRAYVIPATITGTVSSLRAHVGQSTGPREVLMSIVPSDAHLQAELQVPTNAVGFLAPGQEVRIAIDAFPFQRFGTVQGTIRAIAGNAILLEGEKAPTYTIIVNLPKPYVTAYRTERRLLPGMTLAARITTDHRSLIAWLFDPLLAVSRR